jgi:hypothetical protein
MDHRSRHRFKRASVTLCYLVWHQRPWDGEAVLAFDAEGFTWKLDIPATYVL